MLDPEMFADRRAGRQAMNVPTTATGNGPRPNPTLSTLPAMLPNGAPWPTPNRGGVSRGGANGRPGAMAPRHNRPQTWVNARGETMIMGPGGRAVRAPAAGASGPMPGNPGDGMPPSPSPTPGPPVWTQPQTPTPPSGPPFMPGPNGGPWTPPGGPSPTGGNEFLDPMMMFLSAVPGMRLNTQKQIADAMASAGGTGNRWGTSAQRTAGQIGAESGMQENALLQSLLADYSNRQEDRALQATGQATGLGALLDQMAQSRVGVPFGVGQYEQNRQDQFSNTAFQDWSQNRNGWLPMMLQFAASQGAGSPGSPGQIIPVQNNDSSHGTSDWLTLLAGLFG